MTFLRNFVISATIVALSLPAAAQQYPSPTFNSATVNSQLNGKPIPGGALVGTTDTQTLTNKTLVAPNLGSASGSSVTVSGNSTANVQATSLQNFPSVLGSYWYSQGHPNWNIVQTSLNYNPTEWQVYGAAGQGKAHCGNPGVDGTVIRDSGTAFDSAWVGRTGFYIGGAGQLHAAYTVASVTDATNLTLSTPCIGSGSVTFQWVTTSNSGTVNVSGTSVTYVSGQPFNVFSTQTNAWTINGGQYTCSSITTTAATCNTSGVMTGVSYTSDNNIYDEIATWRLQKVIGTNEENLSCTARAIGLYDCRPQFTGSGTLWPWVIGNGNYSFDSSSYNQIGVQPNGDLTLGGYYNRNSVLIPAVSGQYGVNFLSLAGGASGTGANSPSLQARPCGTGCAERTLSLNYDSYGTGAHNFTSHSFGNLEFRILGNGGTSYLTVGSDNTGNPTLAAASSASNSNVKLVAKGTGTINIASPLQLPSTTVALLPTCNSAISGSLYSVTDASAPAYNGALTGGGSVRVPVFCNGTAWTAH